MKIQVIDKDRVFGNSFGGHKSNRMYIGNDCSYLLKTNKLKRDYGKESVLTCHRQTIASEFICCNTLRGIIEVQEVSIGECDEILYAMCKNFKQQNEELIQLDKESSRDLHKEKEIVNDYTRYIEPTVIKRMPESIRQDMKQMYLKLSVLDYLFANPDRHLGNIGLLINKDTGLLKIAPAYDFGAALGSNIRLDNDKDLGDIVYSEVIQEILTPMQRFNGIKLTNYNVKYHLLPDEFYNCITVDDFVKIKMESLKLTRDAMKNGLITEKRAVFINELINIRLSHIKQGIECKMFNAIDEMSKI